MIWDTHMHTHFSDDSQALPEDMIRQAVSLGLAGICFTDHLDLDYPNAPENYLLDLPSYFEKMTPLAGLHDGCLVCTGVELGLQPHLAREHQKILTEYSFDFVIGSSHLAHRMDPYEPEYYKDRPEKEAYLEYFTSILENIAAFDGFDVYGHLDYVVRYGPNKNRFYSYEQYADIIDEILNALIAKGKGIEINTSGFRYGLGHSHPTEKILKRYRELGGELLTIGSDAHKPADIAYDFNRVPAILREAGFRYFTVFRERRPEFVPLPE